MGRGRTVRPARSRRRPGDVRHLRAPEQLPGGKFLRVGQARAATIHANSGSEHALGARVGVRPAPIATVAAASKLRPVVDEGRNSTLPTIGARFDDVSAPGLSRGGTFARTVRSPISITANQKTRGAADGTGSRPAALSSSRLLHVRPYRRRFASVREHSRRAPGTRCSMFVSTTDTAAGARVPFIHADARRTRSLRGFATTGFAARTRFHADEYRFRSMVWFRCSAVIRRRQGGLAPGGAQFQKPRGRVRGGISASTRTTGPSCELTQGRQPRR